MHAIMHTYPHARNNTQSNIYIQRKETTKQTLFLKVISSVCLPTLGAVCAHKHTNTLLSTQKGTHMEKIPICMYEKWSVYVHNQSDVEQRHDLRKTCM